MANGQAGTMVTQVSKPAVSPISKSAERSMSCGLRVWKRRFGNLRYGMFSAHNFVSVEPGQRADEMRSSFGGDEEKSDWRSLDRPGLYSTTCTLLRLLTR